MSINAPAANGTPHGHHPGGPRRLLLVEDDALQREALRDALDGAGYSVSACASADQALARFVHWQPEVAVIDQFMPDMDGLALTERLRAVDPTLGVLILTAAPQIPSVVQALQLGVADFLVKPVSPGRLATAVEAAARKRSADRQKELQRLVHEARVKALEDMNTQLNEFTARVAHDLRSPVRASRLWIEFAREALAWQDSAGAEGFLNSALQSIGAGSGIIDGLLALSKSTLLPLRTTPVNLESTIRSSVEACRVEFQPKVFDVRVDVQGSLNADVVLIGIALGNVIHNAFKYSSLQDAPRIDILAGPRAPGHYAIRVSDNGAGIPAALLDRLFQPFERLAAPAALAGEGIGLSTVKRVLDKHGASIVVQSVEREGTTVAMDFPDLPAPDSPDHRPDPLQELPA